MAGPLNWISQVISVSAYNIRTIPQRVGSAAAAFFGITGVVTVTVGVLSMAQGFHKTALSTGSPDVAMVLRAGASSEMVSGLQRDEVNTIADTDGIARDSNGALASPELFVVISLPKRSTGTDANVPMRGVESTAFAVHNKVKIVAGRRFEPGRDEIIAGVAAAREFKGLDLGKTLTVGNTSWKVVGLFTAGGGNSESEIWTDAHILQDVYNRGSTYQSVFAKLTSPDEFQKFKDALKSNPQLDVKVTRESDYYAENSTALYNFINGLGAFIGLLMAVGAIFGALNTMYSAVASRTREIATLRAMGFGRTAVIISVLVESLFLATLGGVAGSAIAYFVFNGFTATTLNFQSFSQIAFAFAVTPRLLLLGAVIAISVGLIGGLFPAVRAARLPVATALRED